MNKLLKTICIWGIFFLNFNFIFAQAFFKDGIFYQTIDEERVIVVKNPNEGYYGEINIPKEVSILGKEKNFKVVGIKYNAFSNCPNLISIDMKNCNISVLPEFLFFNCINLKNVQFPISLKSIGSNSFVNCNNISVLQIPDGVEIVDDFAFSECHNLEAVYLPDSLKYLGQGAFKNCDKLTNIALSKNLEFIEESCFENCRSLKHVFFGDKVKKIGKFAFKNCTRLENTDFPPSLETIRLSAFARCDNMTEICLPENIKELSSTSFGYCFGIEKIIFKGQRPPKKFAYDAFIYPDSPFPELHRLEIIVPEGAIKNFKGKIESKIKNRSCFLKEENEIILYP